jgi:nicotinamidase-related amidase
MTLTILDPTTALVVIDLQAGIAASPKAHPVGPVVARSAALAQAFREHGLPVVLVNVSGGAPGRTEVRRSGAAARPDGWDRLLPELGAQPGDHLVTKHTWGAFQGTGLDELLRGLGVTQVVVAGIATSIGVESTARQAYEHGYHVTLAVDAMTDMDLVNHEHSVARVFPRLGETGTTQEILDLLAARRP